VNVKYSVILNKLAAIMFKKSQSLARKMRRLSADFTAEEMQEEDRPREEAPPVKYRRRSFKVWRTVPRRKRFLSLPACK
jgi:hypothetical protein